MLLKPGISGFTSIKEYPINISNDRCSNLDFNKVCCLLANGGLFKVLSFDFETVGKNFYICEVYYKEKSVFILLNMIFPYICFATSIQCFNIKYFDDEFLESKFNDFYQVIKKKELVKPLSLEDYKQLNKTEIKQLRYYDSLTVGEVIFNFWD